MASQSSSRTSCAHLRAGLLEDALDSTPGAACFSSDLRDLITLDPQPYKPAAMGRQLLQGFFENQL